VAIRITDPDRDTGKSCLGRGRQCPSASARESCTSYCMERVVGVRVIRETWCFLEILLALAAAASAAAAAA